MTPIISVVIPLYNVEQYLSQCLDSVLKQTLQAIEVIIVNDGSSDRSGIIAREYEKADSRVSVFEQTNQGQSAARNFGLGKARGHYVAFLDSDDWVHPNLYQSLYETARTTGADIVRCGARLVQSDGTEKNDPYYGVQLLTSIQGPASFSNLGDALFQLSVSPTTGMFNRNFLLNHKLAFPLGLVCEDEYFTTLAFLCATRITAISSPSYFYRVREGSTMNSLSNSARQLDLFKVLALLAQELASRIMDESVKRSFFNVKCIPTALFHYRWRIHKQYKLAAWWKLRQLRKCVPKACLTAEIQSEWEYYTNIGGLITRDRRTLRNLPGWLFQLNFTRKRLVVRILGLYLVGHPPERKR